MTNGAGGSDDLEIPFIFVPHGAPEPTEWMAAHPGWVKFPATFVPRERRQEPSYEVAQAIPPSAVMPFIAGAVIGLGAIEEWWSPRRPTEPKVDRGGYPGGTVNAPAEGFSASPPQPPAPGLVPPGGSVSKPGEEGFSPAPHLPPQPGPVPMPPQPHVLPGPDAAPQGAVIHEQNRNDGLEGNLRSDPRRARDAARQADPAVTQVLKDGEWQAHHLINVGNVRDYKDIFDAAAKAGWRTDEVGNVMPLPATAEDQQKLKERGIDRPTHRGAHPQWNDEVLEELRMIRRELGDSSLAEGSDAYNAEARRLLIELEGRLRLELLQKSKIGSLPISKDTAYV